MAVRGHGAQNVDAGLVDDMQVDAVEVVARLLRRDGEAGAVDQAAQLVRGQAESMRQIARGHHREVLDRQAGQGEARPAAAQDHLLAAVGRLDLDLAAVRQLAHDLVKRMRRRRRHADAGYIGVGGLGDVEIHIGRGQPKDVGFRLQLDVRQNRNRVAPLDDALHVRQRLEQSRTVECQFHRGCDPSECSSAAAEKVAAAADPAHLRVAARPRLL